MADKLMTAVDLYASLKVVLLSQAQVLANVNIVQLAKNRTPLEQVEGKKTKIDHSALRG